MPSNGGLENENESKYLDYFTREEFFYFLCKL
jgi:hypothetical protein